MPKDYVAEARMPLNKVKKFIAGGSVSIGKDDLLNDSNPKLRVKFHKLKDLNRYGRNLKSGKKFILKPNMVMHLSDESGGDILSSLKNIGSKMGSAFQQLPGVKNTTVGKYINPFDAGYKLGHDVISPALMKAGVKPAGGSLLKSIGKIASSKPVEKIATVAATKVINDNLKTGGKIKPITKKQVEKTITKIGDKLKGAAKSFVKDNKKELAGLARETASNIIQTANGEHKITGKEFGRRLLDQGDRLAHMAARDIGTKEGIYDKENPYEHGQYKPKPVVVEDVIEGSGISIGLGGKKLVNNKMVNPTHARMAHARSFRKVHGGSFLPL